MIWERSRFKDIVPEATARNLNSGGPSIAPRVGDGRPNPPRRVSAHNRDHCSRTNPSPKEILSSDDNVHSGALR